MNRNGISIFCVLCLTQFFNTAGIAQKNDIVTGSIGQKLDQYLTRCVPFGFSGAVLVTVNGSTVLNKGYGLADRLHSIQNTSETVFPVGSITKQFTAAGILKLEMMGKLHTNDLLSKYIKNMPGDKNEITLHHLLTHTAGMIENTGLDFEEVSRDAMVKRVISAPLRFKPGTAFGYSNAGYSLLAAIIEIVSGQPYEQFLYDQLFKPAGMYCTGYRIPDWNEKVIAHCYDSIKDNGTVLDKPYPYWNYIGNGGILSATDDIYRWHQALLTNNILSVEAKKKFYTPFLNDYAYGWDNLKTDYGTVIQHDGGSTLGYSAEFRRYIDKNVVTIILCNQSYNGVPLFEAVRDKIELIAFGGSVPIAPPVYSSSDVELQKFAGTYKLSSGGILRMYVENHALVISAETNQNAVNALFFQEERDITGVSNLNERTKQLLTSFLNKNYLPMKQSFADTARFGRFLQNWNQGTATTLSLDSIITLPSPTINRKIYQTVIPFRRQGANPLSAVIFRFTIFWENNKIAGIEIQPYSRNSATTMQFQLWSGATYFAGYDLNTARNALITFIMNSDGTPSGLRSITSAGEITALKEK